uniref:Uncharacterized protein n=1 Tax=Octopus bimaculoides TaxID=37653 RepID=A0A0L8FP96_OCTBM
MPRITVLTLLSITSSMLVFYCLASELKPEQINRPQSIAAPRTERDTTRASKDVLANILLNILRERNMANGYINYPSASSLDNQLDSSSQLQKKNTYYGYRRSNGRVPSFGSKIFPSSSEEDSGPSVFRYG